jgi:hypothetical protein
MQRFGNFGAEVPETRGAGSISAWAPQQVDSRSQRRPPLDQGIACMIVTIKDDQINELKGCANR